MLRALIRVYGRVQGVGYRAFVSSVAGMLGVRGSVMNDEDGSVGIVAEVAGEKELAEFVKRIERKDWGISVSKIEVAEKKEISEYSFFGFYIVH